MLFVHDIGHEGSILVKGRKYAIRTDIMYQDLVESELERYEREEEDKKSYEAREE